MSSSYRNLVRGGGASTLAATGLLLMPVTAPVVGADIYWQPTATVAAETDSNIDLDPVSSKRVEGYVTDAAALVGIATQDSDTTLRPRIRYADYPQETALNRVEGMLDVNSRLTSQRGTFSLGGRYDHLNDTEAEAPSAQYNSINPTAPTPTDTGQALVGVTRDYVLVQPRYQYRLSPLVTVGASGLYQNVSFSPSDTSSHVDYSFSQGDVFIDRELTHRVEVSADLFFSRYDARKITSTANSTGGNLSLAYNWTATLTSTVTATFQRADINSYLAPAFHGSQSNWGASGSLVWEGKVEKLRANLGHVIAPGTAGGLYATDQLQFEYDRDLTARLSYVAAVLGLRSAGITSNISQFDRDYVRGDLSAKWMLTRTWILQGGVSYTWSKFRTDPGSASNNQVFLRVGYQGLPAQR